jgi:murein L,D-transpeptidase YafK
VIEGRNAKSAFHRSLKISYPDKRDRENAKRLGVGPGGDIMIHGLTNGLGWMGRAHLKRDWTLGEEIWKLLPDGASVEIRRIHL